MRIALTLVMVCGCVASSYRANVDRAIANFPTSNRTVAAPQSLTPPAWRIGQWAVYKAHVGHAWTLQSIRVVAKDDCGIWIEAATFSSTEVDSWLVCFRDDPTLSLADRLTTAIGSVHGNPTTFHFEHGASAGVSAEMIAGFLDAVALNAYPEDAPREDVTVPGGHFMQALRIDDGKDIRWIHPDVPFNGTITRQRSGVDERVLVGFGETTDRSEVVHLTQALIATERRPSMFFGLGVDFGWLTGHPGESGRGTSTATASVGLPWTEQLDLLVETSLATIDTPDPLHTMNSALVSLRWNPFGRARFTGGPAGLSALYVRAGVGYTGIRDSTMNTIGGIGLEAAIGWIGTQGTTSR
jgi:hypothetical protein